MNELNIEYSFFDAVYGKDLSLEEKEKISTDDFKRRSKKEPIDGELGCTLSHIRLFEKMVRDDMKWACVLEDDAIIDESFRSFISKLDEKKLVDDTQYILGGQDGLVYRNKVVLSHFDKETIGGQVFYKVISGHGYVLRSCGYLVSLSTASRLIKRFNEGFFIIDEWAYLMREGHFSNIYLADFVHHPEDLSNSWLDKERKENNKEKKIKKKKSYLRKKISYCYWITRRYILGFCWWK
ncbi:glycosyltransferase family 25 protein [Kluyvera georgiana]|uniref:glycosyltransferase family 25 protein n=1 Tax=Kluyvera georgiana TaxID=73098 RepID=UPI003D9763A2